jgi:hypothetical protein
VTRLHPAAPLEERPGRNRRQCRCLRRWNFPKGVHLPGLSGSNLPGTSDSGQRECRHPVVGSCQPVRPAHPGARAFRLWACALSFSMAGDFPSTGSRAQPAMTGTQPHQAPGNGGPCGQLSWTGRGFPPAHHRRRTWARGPRVVSCTHVNGSAAAGAASSPPATRAPHLACQGWCRA